MIAIINDGEVGGFLFSQKIWIPIQMMTPFHFNLVMFLIVVVKMISNSGSPLVGIFFSYEFETFVLERLLMGKWGIRRRMVGISCRAFCKISQIKSAGIH